MFEELFTQSWTIERYHKAPLAQHRVRYLRYLRDLGAKRLTLRKLAVDQLHLVHLLDLKEAQPISVAHIEAAATEWARPDRQRYLRRRSFPASRTSTITFFGNGVRWLRFLGWLEEPANEKHDYTIEVGIFEDWMRDQRGYSEESIRSYCDAADRFLKWLTSNDIRLSSLKVTHIDQAIAEMTLQRQYSRSTIKNYAVRVRVLIRFAEDQEWCMPGISAGIIPPRVYPDDSIPSRLSREHVQNLLSTAEGDRAADKRDRAILMLLVAYGLRSGEVRGLRLDDLDWENETLRVRRPKPGRTHLYPLSSGVGQAILRYILEVRPSLPDRTLFLSLAAPIRPLTRVALASMVSRRLDRLGICTKRRGPHSLRHAAAQHLLNQGMSIKVIGDFLGHRDPSSTAIYAKLDLKALREVADFDLEGLV